MQQLIDWLADHPSDRVKVAITDTDGLLRAKYLSRDKLLHALENSFGFCNVIFGWDSHDLLYPAAADPGFADARARIVAESRRTLPWENDLPFLLADFRGDGGVAGTACPRSLLARVIKKAGEMGFTARFGPEYEWFCYRETPASMAEKDHRSPTPLSPGMFGYSALRTGEHAAFIDDLWGGLTAFNIEIEGLHTETGPGVLEAAIAHQPALEAADRAILFKQAVKQIGYRHGLLASFMAKPSAGLPGCGGHLHQSLWRDGENAFYGPGEGDDMSPLLRQYLAGQLKFLPLLLPLYAPTVNSYKRFVPGSWAATRANWGRDNRTVALRVVSGGAASTRLEMRVPGADANPYLAIAAALASGLYGIEHGLELEQKPVVGDAYSQEIGVPLPDTLGAAAGAMRCPEVAELLGSSFVEHFAASREWEWRQYCSAVTDWERRRYFETA